MNEYDELLAGTAAETNEYDALLGEQKDQRVIELRGAAKRAAQTTPDRAAQVDDLSRRTGLPAAVIERNFDAVRANTLVEGNDYDAMLRDSPKLSEWLREGENAAIVADDMKAMGALEWLTTAPVKAWERGRAQVEFGDLMAQALQRDLTATEHRRLEELRQAMLQGGTLGAQSWFGEALVAGAQQLPMLFGGLAAGAQTGIPAATGAATAAAIAGQAGPQIATPEELLTVPAAAATGYYIGATSGAASFGFKQEAGHAFAEFLGLKDETGRQMDPQAARAAAIAAGAINAGLEAFQLNTLLRAIPGAEKLAGKATRDAMKQALQVPTVRAALGQMMASYGRVLSIETLTEVAQRAVTIMSGEIARAAEGMEGQTGAQIAADLVTEGIEAAKAFTYISAPGPVARGALDYQRVREAQKQQAFFEMLGQGVSESAAFQRAPRKVQEFIARATRDSPIETVYMPMDAWRSYWQSQNVDPDAAMRDVMDGDTTLYEAAKSDGTDIPIPLAVYAAKIAPTDANAFLAPEMRLRADELNAREATELEQQLLAQQQEAQQERQLSELDTAVEQIQADLQVKLVNAGVEPGTAQAYAQANAAVFRSISERSGMNPQQLYERYGLQVTREGLTPPEGETALTQQESRDLIIQHNLSEDNLLHAAKMGGIAVPSLAVTHVSNPSSSFGEITLIGPKQMADPQGYARTRVYGADIYSPRYPTVHFKFAENQLRPFNQLIHKWRDLTGQYWFDHDELSTKGVRYLKEHPAVMAAVLAENDIPIVRMPHADKFKADEMTRRAIQDAIYKHKLDRKLDDYASALLREMNPGERIFRGFTYSGNRSYSPHTLENVVKLLKKDLRGGESKANLYGLGQLRAQFTPQFKSVSGIRKAKGLIVTRAQFEAASEEAQQEFYALAESLQPHYTHEPEPFRYYDTVMAVISEAPKLGLQRAAKEYGFNELPDEARQAVWEFTTRLKNMPTEYFEAKILRGVGIEEFRAAAVPHDVRPEVMRELLKAGIQVETYQRGNDADRARAIGDLAHRYAEMVLFQGATFDNATGQLVTQPPFYSVLQRSIEMAKLDRAPPEQWKKFIASLTSKGVKKEEIVVSGVLDWLDLMAAEIEQAKHGKLPKSQRGLEFRTPAGNTLRAMMIEHTQDERAMQAVIDSLSDAVPIGVDVGGVDAEMARNTAGFMESRTRAAYERGEQALAEEMARVWNGISVNGLRFGTQNLPATQQSPTGRVSKEDVLAFLDQNHVKVETEILGEPPAPVVVEPETEVTNDDLPEGYRITRAGNQYVVRAPDGGVIAEAGSEMAATEAAEQHAEEAAENEITDEEIEARAQQLLEADIPQLAEQYARESDYVNRSYNVALRPADYSVRFIDDAPGITGLFTGRVSRPHYRVLKLTYAEGFWPDDDAVTDDAYGSRRLQAHMPDHRDEFWEMVFGTEERPEPQEGVTAEIIGEEFETEEAAHAWAEAQGLRPEPAWYVWDSEDNRDAERDGQEAEDWSDARNIAQNIRDSNFESELEYYRNDYEWSVSDFGDRYLELARQELEEERDQGGDWQRGRAQEGPRTPPTRHPTKWQSQGGRDYRELVLGIPGIESYKSGDTTHFGDVFRGRTVAWARFKIHQDDNLEPTLWVEEIQSQRAQHAREQREQRVRALAKERGITEKEAAKLVPSDAGFSRTPTAEEKRHLNDLHDQSLEAGAAVTDLVRNFNAFFGTDYFDHQGHGVIETTEREFAVPLQESGISADAAKLAQFPVWRERINQAQTIANAARIAYEAHNQAIHGGTIPPAPFVKDTQAWSALAWKRLLRYAAEKGIKQVAWTTGAQQVHRYGNWLREQIDEIVWSKTQDGVEIQAKQRGTTKVERKFSPEGLRNVLGVSMAQQIINDPNQEGVISGQDITLDDVGMAYFYGDQDGNNPDGKPAVMRIVADKIVKQLGGKGVESVGITVAEGGQGGGMETFAGAPGFEITEEMRLNILQGQALFQSSTPEDARGRVRWGQDRQFRIDLLENADLTTFLHESGHFWLEVFGDVVDEISRQDPATLTAQQVRMAADYQAILKWMGVKSRNEIGVKEHEKWARGIEAYFMEGNAPSADLRSIFARVRAWMLAVYRSLRQLKVDLTPEVRAVMDRLLASDAEIDAATREAEITPLFADTATLTAAGFDERFVAAYRDKVQAASDRAKDELQAKLMRTLTRERTRWWNDERAKLRDSVEAELQARPVYIALSVLQDGAMPDGSAPEAGPLKLGRAHLPEGEHKRLPRGVTTTEAGGLTPDMAAELFGFDSGEALLAALREAVPLRQAVEAEIDAQMLARYGDPAMDGSLVEEARAAVHSEARAQVIQAELQALAKMRAAAAPAVAVERASVAADAKARLDAARVALPLETVRRMAAGRVAQMRVRDLQPHLYLTAARKASQAAFQALAAGDYGRAITEKQRELLNVELYRAARNAREEVEQTVDYMQGFGEAKKRARVAKAGQSYLDQIDGFLDRYEFARVTLKALERRKALAAWVDEQEKQGLPVNLPDEVVVERRVNYKDMRLDELRGVRDSVKHIEHLARLKNKLLTAKAKAELDVVLDEIETSIRDHTVSPKGRPIETRLPTDETARLVDKWFASHRKLASILRQLDGGLDAGALWRYVLRPINAAADDEAAMNAETTRKLGQLFDVYKGKEQAALYRKEVVPAVGASMTKMARLMVALNWGTKDNRAKLLAGRGWSESQGQAILDTLDERDWRFVQGVWDLIDSFWDEIAAKERRVNGIAPEKVEADAFATRFGEQRGGYFPLKYEDRLSPKAAGDRAADIAEQMMKGAYSRATTRRGHTKARVEGVREPVRLDFGVIFEHLGQVIHDVTHHEMLIDVNRLVGAKPVANAIIEGYGDVIYKEIQKAITDIAAGEVPAIEAWEKSINWLRQGVSIVGMGWNLMTSLLQPIGLSQSIVRIGPKYVARGLSRWLSDAARFNNTAGWIKEKSTFMATRMNTQMREINEIRNSIGLSRGKLGGWVDEILGTVTLDTVHRHAIADSYFWLIYRAQQVADIPTWLGAYEKAHDQGHDEDTAIALADQAVLDSQGGGQTKDLAAIQRGGPMLKIWTNFYSYFNVTWNLAVEAKKRARLEPAALARLAIDVLLLTAVPATLGALMRHALVGDDDDEGELARRVARENVSYALGLMVGVRELSGAVMGYAGYEGPAGTRFFSTITRLVKQVEHGEVDAAMVKALNDAAGILLHYPAGQVRRTVEGYIALQEDRTDNPLALLVGAPRDNR